MLHNKIIFLDIDGVLATQETLYEKFSEKALFQLERIVKETGAKIVVSSSWRCGDLQLTKNALMEAGYTQFLSDLTISETIRKYHHTKEKSYLVVCRGNEIATWVDRSLKYPWHAHPEMDAQYRTYKEDGSFKIMRSNKAGVDYSYVILDDDNDMLLCQKDYFVRTYEPEGLSEQNATEAIKILNKIDNVITPKI